MSYSRDAAVDYARRNWNTNCHDGVISIIGGPIISVEAKKRQLGLSPSSDWKIEWMRKYRHSDDRGNMVEEQEAANFVGPGVALFLCRDGMA